MTFDYGVVPKRTGHTFFKIYLVAPNFQVVTVDCSSNVKFHHNSQVPIRLIINQLWKLSIMIDFVKLHYENQEQYHSLRFVDMMI